MNRLLDGIMPDGYRTIIPLKRVGLTPFMFGSLGLIYGMDGSGKSYQTAKLLKEAGKNVVKVFIDADGSTGKTFADWCDTNGVELIIMSHLKMDVDGFDKMCMLKKVRSTIEFISDRIKDKKIIFVLDSLTAIGEGQKINNAEDISPLFYKINDTAKHTGNAIVLIDHATPIRDTTGAEVNFRLEGNATAKRRPTSSVVRYEPAKRDEPKLGGTFTVERSRSDEINIKDTFVIENGLDLNMAIEWVKAHLSEKFTQGQFSKATQNTKDKWVRQFKDEMFDSYDDGMGRKKTTIHKLKEVN